jgi:hypothetical protein
MIKIQKLMFCGILLFHGCTSGCSSAPKKDQHALHHILLHNLHYRRTETVGADPAAHWGDWEFQSHPLPNSTFDCQPLNSLFNGLLLTPVRGCLSQLNSEKEWKVKDGQEEVSVKKELNYILHRETAPFLELEKAEKTPECIRTLLSKIPVPREIFFQSNDEGKLGCYNSRIPIVQQELGIQAALHHLRVKIAFPLESLPQTDEETLMLLATWAIIPYWDSDKKSILSKAVPSEICSKCIGERNLYHELDSLPPQWP